jgi:hypothetical protein
MSEHNPLAFNLPDMIETVRTRGGLIHDLPPIATRELAVNYGLYTTTEQRDPGNFLEFHRTLERERAFETIARNVGSILGKTELYQEAVHEGALGRNLIDAFGSICKIECKDVHLVQSDVVAKEQQGIVTASKTLLTVPSGVHAEKVSVAIQALLSTGSLETFYPVTTETKENGTAIVTVGMLDEHAARSLSRSVEAVVAQEDKKHGVTLPPDKRTYQDWTQRGETFPPAVDQRLRQAAAAYKQLEIAGTYRDRPYLKPRPKPRIIGNDAAPFFEGIRDVLNGLIHHVRGGSHLNLEQHPYKIARPLVEAGIDLRRDKATLEQVKYGPLSSRPAHLTEKGKDEGWKRIEEARKKPLTALAKATSGALSLPAGVLGIGGSTIKYLPASSEAARELAAIQKEWLRRRELAAAGGLRLGRIASQLRRREYGLMEWE